MGDGMEGDAILGCAVQVFEDMEGRFVELVTERLVVEAKKESAGAASGGVHVANQLIHPTIAYKHLVQCFEQDYCVLVVEWHQYGSHVNMDLYLGLCSVY